VGRIITFGWGAGVVLASTFAPEILPTWLKQSLFFIWLSKHRNNEAKLQSYNIKLSPLNPSIYRINQPELPNKPPLYSDIILLILWTFIFIIGSLVFYYIIKGRITTESNTSWQWLGFIILCFIIPILVWINTFVWNRNSIKKGKSWTFKEIEFTYIANEDIDLIFLKCYEALMSMNAKTPIKMERPKLIKVPVNERIFTVTINKIRKDRFSIKASSDTQYLTTKIDYGVNKRNINDFQLLLLKEQKSDENIVAFKAKGQSNISVTSSKISGYPELASTEDQAKIEFDDTDITK
jgi:hypothetical protein